MYLLTEHAGPTRNRLGVLREHLRPHRNAGSIVYRPVAGYQVVVGADFERNTKREHRAISVPVSNVYDARLLHAALTRWADRQRFRPAPLTPPVIYLGAPAVPDDAPRTRQLALFTEVAA